MKIVGRDILEAFTLEHADARGWISSWVAEVEFAIWTAPHEIKARYATASFLVGNTVIFNVKGNTYRLEINVSYKISLVRIVWIGTHAEYTKRS